MAKKFKRLLGCINDDRDCLVGFVVLTVDEENNINSADPRGVNEVKAMLSNGIVIDNVVLKDGQLRGTEGSLNRLPIFSTKCALISVQKYTILNRIKGKTESETTGFLVMDSFGKKAPLSYNKVLEMMAVPDSFTNAKIVPKDGKRVISAIKGEFEVIEVAELRRIVPQNTNNGNTEAQEKPVFKKFRPRKYLWEQVKNNISHNNDKIYPFDTVKLIKDCNDEKVTISNVNEIQGIYAKRYNAIIGLSIMCRSKNCNKVTAGDALSISIENPSNNYNDRFRRLVGFKKNHNTMIRILRDKQEAFNTTDVAKLIERKEAGGYLTSAEFKLYYAATHDANVMKYLNLEENVKGLTLEENKSLHDTMKKRADSVLSEFFGIVRLKERIRKSKGAISKYQNKFFPTDKVDLLSSDLPFFNEYIRRGKLDFVLKYAQDLECYKKNIRSKEDLKEHLDALFIIAVAHTLGSRSERIKAIIMREAKSQYDGKFRDELVAIVNGKMRLS